MLNNAFDPLPVSHPAHQQTDEKLWEKFSTACFVASAPFSSSLQNALLLQRVEASKKALENWWKLSLKQRTVAPHADWMPRWDSFVWRGGSIVVLWQLQQRTMAFLLSEKYKKCVSTNKRETRSPSQSVGIVSSVHSPTHNTVGTNFLQSEKKQAKNNRNRRKSFFSRLFALDTF